MQETNGKLSRGDLFVGSKINYTEKQSVNLTQLDEMSLNTVSKSEKNKIGHPELI